MRFPLNASPAFAPFFGGAENDGQRMSYYPPTNYGQQYESGRRPREIPFLPPNDPWSRGNDPVAEAPLLKEVQGTCPLYTWEKRQKGDRARTRFFKTVGYSQFVSSPGHPWCRDGFTEAFGRTIGRLMQSEVSVVLANAAAGITGGEGLVFDADSGDFVAGSRDSLLPSFGGGDKDSVYNSVALPVLAQIIKRLFVDADMSTKLRDITDMLCQLSDAEAEARPFGDNNVYFCFIEDLVAVLLVCGQSEQPVDCNSTMEIYTQSREDFPDSACHLNPKVLQSAAMSAKSFRFNDKGLQIPILFLDQLKGGRGKVPRNIPAETMIQESMTYLALFRGLMIASSFSRAPYLCGAEEIHTPILVPGWDVPMVIARQQEGEEIFAQPVLRNDALPAIFISQSQTDPCSFIILARGTASMLEWFADFMTGQVPFPLRPDIAAHEGMSNLFATEAPLIDAYIRQQTQEHHCPCDQTHLIFTGHSLGAGVAQLLAFYFAERYGVDACGADISGAFFAPPRMFNDSGSEYFRTHVNGRVLYDTSDGLAYMPCYEGNAKQGWSKCPRGHMSMPGEGRDYYAEFYGLVEFTTNYSEIFSSTTLGAAIQTLLPSTERNKPSFFAAVLNKLIGIALPSLNAIPSLGVLGAAHVCSVACRFSTEACGEEFRWWCDTCPQFI